MSSSSGRARQRISSGASLTRSARCSISSSSGSSAQWTSSKTRISGRASASSAAHSRAAHAISCWLRSASIPSSTPTASASRSATASSPQQARSFETASWTGSSSVIPAATLTISASGQYVTPSPYGQRAADEHRRALDAFDELAGKPALADAGLAVDREQMGALAAGSRGRACSRAARARTRARRSGQRPTATRPSRLADSSEPPGDQGLAEALQRSIGPTSSVSTAPIVSRCAKGPTRISPGCASLLEPRRDVDRLAGREGRVGLVGDDLARLDADPRLEPELVHRVEDRRGGADGALGVVLVRLRDPERGHDGVAGELLDDAAVRGDAVRDVLEERVDAAADDLRVAARRRARSSRRDRRRARSRACVPSRNCSYEGGGSGLAARVARRSSVGQRVPAGNPARTVLAAREVDDGAEEGLPARVAESTLLLQPRCPLELQPVALAGRRSRTRSRSDAGGSGVLDEQHSSGHREAARRAIDRRAPSGCARRRAGARRGACWLGVPVAAGDRQQPATQPAGRPAPMPDGTLASVRSGPGSETASVRRSTPTTRSPSTTYALRPTGSTASPARCRRPVCQPRLPDTWRRAPPSRRRPRAAPGRSGCVRRAGRRARPEALELVRERPRQPRSCARRGPRPGRPPSRPRHAASRRRPAPGHGAHVTARTDAATGCDPGAGDGPHRRDLDHGQTLREARDREVPPLRRPAQLLAFPPSRTRGPLRSSVTGS